MSNTEIIKQIAEIQVHLLETDYVALKIAEGEATQEEYADVLANRREWRNQISELREQLVDVPASEEQNE